MLRKESAVVRLYLERAADASEKAAAAADPGTPRFYLAIESKWTDLAANTAFVERVDLFLQTREFRLRLSPPVRFLIVMIGCYLRRQPRD